MTEENKLIAYAVRLLAGRRYHTAELKKKLGAKVDDPALIEAVIDKLKSYKYLDDGEYVRLYIQDRVRAKPQGVRLIRFRLMQKGIPAAEIRDQIDRLGIDETGLASAALLKKIKSLNGLPREKQKEKLQRFLASRGFGGAAVSTAVKSYFEPLHNQ